MHGYRLDPAEGATHLMRIVINADDYGLSDGICQAIIELLSEGAISNTTVMMASAGSVERLERYGASNISGFAGVHLQLTNGTPLSSAFSAKQSGARFLSRAEMAGADPDAVYLEWKAQVDCFVDIVGVLPTHLDSHQGFHRQPRFTPVYLALAKEYGLAVRGGEPPLPRLMADLGVRGTTQFVRGWSGRGKSAAALQTTLLELRARSSLTDVIEVTTHPGYPSDELGKVSSLNALREVELLALRELAAESWLADNGLHLVSFPDLSTGGGS